jgi:mannose-6-phosphate isomerase-like protein (cupin superfamily)
VRAAADRWEVAGVTSTADRVIRYAGQDVRVLADWPGQGQGFAMVELQVPAGFGGPPPHLHRDFDEGVYVLDGELVVLDGETERTVPAGGLAILPRGRRHAFANPSGTPVRVLGIWTPPVGLRFLEDLGAVLTTEGEPDHDALAEVYRRHNSAIVA